MKKIVDEAKKIAGIEKMDLYLSDEELMKQDQEFYYNEGYDKGISEGYDKGINEGYDKGINEGYDKGINKVINQMKKNGYTDDDIIKMTGISLEEISKKTL